MLCQLRKKKFCFEIRRVEENVKSPWNFKVGGMRASAGFPLEERDDDCKQSGRTI